MPPPSPHPPPHFPLFFVSLAHFTLVRRPSRASHFFASCQPTNQAAKSFSDVAPTDKWSALGLPACGHYWSMRFSLLLLLLLSLLSPLLSPRFLPSRIACLSPSSFTPSCLHFILRHALSLSFSFPRDTRSRS